MGSFARRIVRPTAIELAPGRRVHVEKYDGTTRWLEAGETVTLPRREARRLIRAGHALRVA